MRQPTGRKSSITADGRVNSQWEGYTAHPIILPLLCLDCLKQRHRHQSSQPLAVSANSNAKLCNCPDQLEGNLVQKSHKSEKTWSERLRAAHAGGFLFHISENLF